LTSTPVKVQVSAIDSLVVDYDSNTTYQKQGYGYIGITFIDSGSKSTALKIKAIG